MVLTVFHIAIQPSTPINSIDKCCADIYKITNGDFGRFLLKPKELLPSFVKMQFFCFAFICMNWIKVSTSHRLKLHLLRYIIIQILLPSRSTTLGKQIFYLVFQVTAPSFMIDSPSSIFTTDFSFQALSALNPMNFLLPQC